MTRVSIIGTAFRKEDANKLTRDLFAEMKDHAQKVISQLRSYYYISKLDLISGGAAGADQLAVSLYLAGLADSLTLYFPAKWNGTEFDESSQDGRTANYYHYQFSSKLVSTPGMNTFVAIRKALNKGARYEEITEGFKARNLLVGDTDILIAYTFGKGGKPKARSGTLHTWNRSTAKKKLHFDLNEF